MNKYIKNFILSIANTTMSLAFPIITFPYVSRILGPTNLGIINFAQSYGYYFTHIASFGINSYAIREVSRVRNDKAKVEKICNELFNLNLFFSILSTFLYFIGVFFVKEFQEYFIIYLIYSVVIFTNFLSIDWILQSYDDYLFSTIRGLIVRIFSLVSVFIFIKHENDFVLYMLISSISSMGSKISTLMYCIDNYAKLKISIHYLNFKEHIKPMFTLFSFRLVNGISSNLDKLMIGFMMAYAYVGIYSAGVKFILILSPIVETVGIVLFPKINISAGSSIEEYLKNLKINYELILLMGIPMSIGMFLISGRLIPMFAGGKYLGAVNVSKIMAFIILLGPIGDMLGSKTLLVFKKDKWLLYCSTIVAFSNIILNFVLIPTHGIYGAAVASVLSYLISVISRYYFTLKVIHINLFNFKIIKYSLFTLPFIIIYICFKKNIDNDNIWMFGYIGICILIYFIELFFSRDYLFNMIIKNLFKKKVHIES